MILSAVLASQATLHTRFRLHQYVSNALLDVINAIQSHPVLNATQDSTKMKIHAASVSKIVGNAIRAKIVRCVSQDTIVSMALVSSKSQIAF